jgi:hypothetical protein
MNNTPSSLRKRFRYPFITSSLRSPLRKLTTLGKLSRRTGKREQARGHLITATTMYREMDMRFWLEQAEAEIGPLA